MPADAFASPKKTDDENKVKLGLDKNDFVIRHRDDDPYGFWWISREKGQVPEELRGAYTSLSTAEAAILEYIG